MPQRHTPEPPRGHVPGRADTHGHDQGGYQWQGDETGMSQAEVERRLAEVRAEVERRRPAGIRPTPVPKNPELTRLRRPWGSEGRQVGPSGLEPRRPVPPGPDTRPVNLWPIPEPPAEPARDDRRCRRCGYKAAKCSCPRGPLL